MKIKHLVKKHQKLLGNNNFRNNQNYVLGNYLKAIVSRKYKKDFNFTKFYRFFIVLMFPIIFYGFLLENGPTILVGSVLLFLPYLIYLIYRILKNMNFYKKYYFKKDKFVGKRYMFRKKIRDNISRNDYIIFNK